MDCRNLERQVEEQYTGTLHLYLYSLRRQAAFVVRPVDNSAKQNKKNVGKERKMIRIASIQCLLLGALCWFSAAATAGRRQQLFRPAHLAASLRHHRALEAVLVTRGGSKDGVFDDDEEEEEYYSAEEEEEVVVDSEVTTTVNQSSLVSRLLSSILKLVTRTLKALLGTGSTVNLDSVDDETDVASSLATLYDLDEPNETTTILGGSLKQALSQARDDARLVVVFVPSKSHSKNKVAVSALLSPEVTSAAEKQFKKSGTGSYLVYTSQQTPKLKGLQVHSNRPLLFVMHPVTKKILVQHHCSPPPDGKKLALWLKSLSKRHKKQFVKLQKLRQEKIWQSERLEGYKSSQVTDTQQKIRLEQERIQSEKESELAKQRELAIQERRQKLKESLGPEATTGKTIALSHDNNRYQRKFSSSASVNDVFDWADVVLEVEREGIVLQSLQEKFVYEDDRTLEEAGLKQMVLFRVLERKPEPVKQLP